MKLGSLHHKKHFSFICCATDEEMLNRMRESLNLNSENELIILRDSQSLSIAYSKAEEEAKHDLLVYVHQDIIFYPNSIDTLIKRIEEVESLDNEWALVGVFGCILSISNRIVTVYSYGSVEGTDCDWVWNVDKLPKKVHVLDPVICIKKRNVLEWDKNIPTFHGPVEDLCYQALIKEKKGVWVINLPIKHLTPKTHPKMYPQQEIEKSSDYLIKKWGLPLVCGATVWG